MSKYAQCYAHGEEVYRDEDKLLHIHVAGDYVWTVVCEDRLFIINTTREIGDYPLTRVGVLHKPLTPLALGIKETNKTHIGRRSNDTDH